jgi:hypothetical protein
VRDIAPFQYAWPVFGTEEFDRAAVFSITTQSGPIGAVLAWTRRDAWGKNRARSVVFRHNGDDDTPGRWYPWTEFVETDDGRYAATIPNPDKPRSTLAEGDPLPERYSTQTVARSDELFDSISRGPSLRVVVDADDAVEMVGHGYWVAQQRGRIFR